MAAVIAAAPEQRSRLLIAAAVLFAAIAAVLVFVALQNGGEGSGSGAPAAATTSVAVAARDIPANTKLTASMLELRALPDGARLTDAFTGTAALVGQATRFPVQAGEQLTPLKVGLNQIDDEKDVALVLTAGMRGFAVQVTEVTGVGGLLLPGNFVDVIAVYAEPAGSGESRAVTLLQDVELLAVGQEAQEPVPALPDDAASGLSGRRPDDVERQPDARSATLAVTPQEAQLLALAQETGGVIWLSLRPAGDHETVSADEANLQQLGAAAAPQE